MDTPNQPAAATGTPVASVPADPLASDGSSADRADTGDPTTTKLLTGLASRLRAAYEQGAELDDLAMASHQSVAEVRELLTLAGADPSEPVNHGVVPPPRSGSADGMVPQPPAAAEGWVSSIGRPRPRIRRQAPARRMRAVGSAGPVGSGGPEVNGPVAAEAATMAAAPSAPAPVSEPRSAPAAPLAPEAIRPEAPLGVLIGSPRPAVVAAARTEELANRRVNAKIIKVGQGTTLAILPSWRSSIAISVPTELLVSSTGLTREELRQAELTVVVNLEALHDRELRPRDWQANGDRHRRG
ncbi:hypothetical protein C7C46_18615 [Streptomyces tateyamensis]|uniref:Uncharacterized protein n=2 Tax=Streptomyces tateyamensis TaxID=565073 RepID=A0A2V4NNW3_9ACTN|nr:hypothetical protein C7C46_18615 [Streptomyces tateyamensis]